MFQLKGRQDLFRLLFPKNFIVPELEKKYTQVLKSKYGFYKTPIDFINESIKSVEVLGFSNAAFKQGQPVTGSDYTRSNESISKNAIEYQYSNIDFSYRNSVSPISLTDCTLNVTFRHSLGYLNYFLLFENFQYLYARDTPYKDFMDQLNIDIFNEIGSIYCRIVLYYPIINAMDMLSFDYSQPIAQSKDFKVEFKYSNFDFQFLDIKKGDDF